MKQFLIRPLICQLETCREFADEFQLGPSDLVLSNEYIYMPYFGGMGLNCHVMFQEKYDPGEPSDEMVEAMYRDMPKGITRIIAIGGGAVIDVAKLLSLKHVTPILDLYDGKMPITRDKTLLIVPTTCGTGSEVTNISILALISRNTKKGLADEALFADKAILIPELLEKLPFRFFASSAIDALTHAVESSLSPKATPFSKLFGHRAIEMILRGFMEIREKGQEARIPLLGNFLVASCYGGIAFGNAGCAAVHALSYPLGAMYHVPHGEANYAMFTGVLNKYMSIKSDGEIAWFNRYVADILGCGVEAVYEELEALLDVMLPKKALETYGMKFEDIQAFTDSVRENQQRLMANNFVPLDDEAVYDIYHGLYYAKTEAPV